MTTDPAELVKRNEIAAELRKRLEGRIYVGMHNTHYLQTAVEVLFDLVSEKLAKLDATHEQSPGTNEG